MTKSYLMGGKLGDFIHSLIVCKRIYERTGEKAVLYLSNIGDTFERPLEFTHAELKPILESQEWLSEFNIHQGEPVDISLNDFRQSPHLYRTNWLNIYFKTFLNEEPPLEYKWIDMPKRSEFGNSLIVNRAIHRYGYMQPDVIESYKRIMSNFEEKYFVCFDSSQFENFQLNSEFELIVVKDLYEYFQIINSGKLFIGNQSGPYAWASAMNVPRILEILRNGQHVSADGMHYLTDNQYYQNFGII